MKKLIDLSPKELFYKQKTAFINNDRKLLKKITKIVRERLNKKEIGNWEKAKVEFNEMYFPNRLGELVSRGEYYKMGRDIYLLETYRLYFKSIEGYRVEGRYNFCSRSQQTRNQYLIIINQQERKIYRKDFIKNGKIVKN